MPEFPHQVFMQDARSLIAQREVVLREELQRRHCTQQVAEQEAEAARLQKEKLQAEADVAREREMEQSRQPTLPESIGIEAVREFMAQRMAKSQREVQRQAQIAEDQEAARLHIENLRAEAAILRERRIHESKQVEQQIGSFAMNAAGFLQQNKVLPDRVVRIPQISTHKNLAGVMPWLLPPRPLKAWTISYTPESSYRTPVVEIPPECGEWRAYRKGGELRTIPESGEALGVDGKLYGWQDKAVFDLTLCSDPHADEDTLTLADSMRWRDKLLNFVANKVVEH